jgi:UPF0042 nucleotide-binding protein
MKALRKNPPFTIVVTGLSGAGKTIALNAFEDSNYFCVDNLPASLIKTFVLLCHKTPDIARVAIGVDIRERKFSANLNDIIGSLKKNHEVEIIFLEAGEKDLVRRYNETRRPHPLGYKDLKKAIQQEKKTLSEIRNVADRIIDTSSLSPHQLRNIILQLYSGDRKKPMTVSLVSFGYKYGVPADADLLFDVRFLPNPYFVKGLKPLPGTSQKVKRFVLGKKETRVFLEKLYPLLEFLLPHYQIEGKNYFTIGVGCTGGMHRSPVIVEELKKVLKKKKLSVSVTHRDLDETTNT